jgi:hypothetical protein
MAHTLAVLKSFSDDELTTQYDAHAKNTVVGTNHYLEELRYREQSRIAVRMEQTTNQIWWFTFVVTVSTIISTALTARALFR